MRNKPTSPYAQGIGKAHTEAVWRHSKDNPLVQILFRVPAFSSGFKKGFLK
jgi:hypothetical protein